MCHWFRLKWTKRTATTCWALILAGSLTTDHAMFVAENHRMKCTSFHQLYVVYFAGFPRLPMKETCDIKYGCGCGPKIIKIWSNDWGVCECLRYVWQDGLCGLNATDKIHKDTRWGRGQLQWQLSKLLLGFPFCHRSCPTSVSNSDVSWSSSLRAAIWLSPQNL